MHKNIISNFTFVNLLFLISIVFCKECGKVQTAIMMLPEGGFEQYTGFIKGSWSFSNRIPKYHPIAWSHAKFPNGVIVYAGVLKSANHENYNFKFIFTADRRKKFARFNNNKPLYRAMDVQETEHFRTKFYKFRLDYDDCEYHLHVREQNYERHYQLA